MSHYTEKEIQSFSQILKVLELRNIEKSRAVFADLSANEIKKFHQYRVDRAGTNNFAKPLT